MEGKIVKGIGGFYYVKTKDQIIECRARGKFRHKDLKPLVGDDVTIALTHDKGIIEDIHDRSSCLIRPNVANVTQAFVVFAIKNPDLNYDLLNRFLITCEYNNIKAIVCLNKVDLVSDEEKEIVRKKINDIGYDVLFINAKKGEGIDLLKSRLKDNVTVLCGPSGAGKSTLINTLILREHMETGVVSEKIGRGKHTTRHSELIEIENGYLVDSPGFSNISTDYIKEDELRNCFPEFEEYNNGCKFRGCLHYKEPGCLVKDALDKNKINEYRYNIYIRILEEIKDGGKNKW